MGGSQGAGRGRGGAAGRRCARAECEEVIPARGRGQVRGVGAGAVPLGGGVRITHPATLHGSMQASGKDVRRTVLPWFVAVAEDGTTLDVEESDNYEQVGFAHLTRI